MEERRLATRDRPTPDLQSAIFGNDFEEAGVTPAVVWGPDHDGDPRTIDVHVRWIRSKIEADPERPAHLVTVRGLGYRLDPPGG